MEPVAGIATTAQAVVGAALIALAIVSIIPVKRLSGNVTWVWGSAGVLILFGLLAGAALVLPSLSPALSPWILGLNLTHVAWTSAAALAPLAGAAMFLLIQFAMTMPSRADLERRVAAHKRTLDKLRDTRKELEERVQLRTREVYEAKKRLELALRGTNITVAMQDCDLRYVWIRNAPSGFDAQSMIGRTDAEILPNEASQRTMTLKRSVIETGRDEHARIVVEGKGKARYFDLTAEPYRTADGVIEGLLSVAVEVTEQKEREDRLRSVLREMSHRSKNTLTILLGIARQTAQRSGNVREFLDSFDARLRALVASQDLLVEHDWRPIPLDELLRIQVKPYLNFSERRLHLEGPDVRIKAEPAQNLGLALHELARNAHTFGALSDAKGQIKVNWSLGPGEEPTTLKIVWQEYDGPIVKPPTAPAGFGRTMTEQLLSRALDGRATTDYRPEGVICEIDVSMAHVEVFA